jgi:hypothetical protein
MRKEKRPTNNTTKQQGKHPPINSVWYVKARFVVPVLYLAGV